MSTTTFRLLAGIALLVSQASLAWGASVYVDITRPGDPVKLVNGFNQGDGDFGPPPASEVETHAFDDVGQKYLNFLDLSSGVAVTPSANPEDLPVVGLRLYTANDAVPRDPASYQLSGSNDGMDGPWTWISSGNLALPDGRNAGGDAVAIPPEGNPDAFHQTVMFANSDSYAYYQVIFPTLKDAAAANSMQIAEIELLVEGVPEPATGLMMGLGVLGLAALRRRRK